MTCGCKAIDSARARAAICVVCAGPAATACPASGHPITMHVNGQPCPRGKHPACDGTVRACGLRWMGVPAPVRWWLWLRHFRGEERGRWAAKFTGCGCIQWLKERWERAKRLVSTNGV